MEPSSNKPRTAYTSDVSDAEWEFCQPYLLLMKEDAPQQDYSLREVFNALRYIVRCGCQWCLMPHDLPPWQNVYQQTQRWMKARCFEAMAHDLRELAGVAKGRNAQPTAAIMDGRTQQSSPESGGWAGYDGYKRRKGSKVHIAVDTLGHLQAVKVTAANEQERARVPDRPLKRLELDVLAARDGDDHLGAIVGERHGGAFLVGKATHEIYEKMEVGAEHVAAAISEYAS